MGLVAVQILVASGTLAKNINAAYAQNNITKEKDEGDTNLLIIYDPVGAS